MKYFLSFVLFCFLAAPASLLAQSSPVGDWTSSGVNDEGQSWTFKVSIKADNTYTVDFGADGKVEITGTYKLEGNQITVQDDEGNQCTGIGVYTYTNDGSTLTMTKVSDECEGRGADGVMRMTRA